MSSEWSWCAGFVTDRSQEELWKNIKATVEMATDHSIQAVSEGQDIEPRFEFTVISPLRNNWTAFWNWSWRFSALVFITQKLTGVLGRAWIDGLIHYDPKKPLDIYNFCVFDKGVITDWFVLYPIKEFGNWGPVAVQDVLVPYFESKLVEEEFVRADFSRISNVVKQHLDVFTGRRIIDYRKPETSVAEAEKLLSVTTIGGLSNYSKAIDLPFFGPAFTIDLLASVIRRQNDNMDWKTWLTSMMDKLDAGDKQDEWLDLVASLKPMWFQCANYRSFYDSYGGKTIYTDY